MPPFPIDSAATTLFQTWVALLSPIAVVSFVFHAAGFLELQDCTSSQNAPSSNDLRYLKSCFAMYVAPYTLKLIVCSPCHRHKSLHTPSCSLCRSRVRITDPQLFTRYEQSHTRSWIWPRHGPNHDETRYFSAARNEALASHQKLQQRISMGLVAGMRLSEAAGTTQLPFLKDHWSNNESGGHTKKLFEEVSATISASGKISDSCKD